MSMEEEQGDAKTKMIVNVFTFEETEETFGSDKTTESASYDGAVY